ncbi:hypothetical protein Glove_406g91 [Diversispora epigaea]|uniref:DUF659 domain-containing protein n=1 Tax=Diversispora epigaea TaxID=1348612 RepID=A0A397H330_9GLOM|nr:hypothetical protein Glove_406g91 [Diversispora epigaea]
MSLAEPSNENTKGTKRGRKESQIWDHFIKESIEDNLTLAVDGWSDSLGRSIYAFIITRKQYIHALTNESANAHTGSFNASEMEKVLNSIGPQKFVAMLNHQCKWQGD